MIHDTSNHCYRDIARNFKPVVNKRASSLMSSTYLQWNLCSSFFYKLGYSTDFHRQMSNDFVWVQFAHFHRKHIVWVVFLMHALQNLAVFGFPTSLVDMETPYCSTENYIFIRHFSLTQLSTDSWLTWLQRKDLFLSLLHFWLYVSQWSIWK